MNTSRGKAERTKSSKEASQGGGISLGYESPLNISSLLHTTSTRGSVAPRPHGPRQQKGEMPGLYGSAGRCYFRMTIHAPPRRPAIPPRPLETGHSRASLETCGLLRSNVLCFRGCDLPRERQTASLLESCLQTAYRRIRSAKRVAAPALGDGRVCGASVWSLRSLVSRGGVWFISTRKFTRYTVTPAW